jgi:hypothetical protein
VQLPIAYKRFHLQALSDHHSHALNLETSPLLSKLLQSRSMSFCYAEVSLADELMGQKDATLADGIENGAASTCLPLVAIEMQDKSNVSLALNLVSGGINQHRSHCSHRSTFILLRRTGLPHLNGIQRARHFSRCGLLESPPKHHHFEQRQPRLGDRLFLT